jgi:hypothetical protein
MTPLAAIQGPAARKARDWTSRTRCGSEALNQAKRVSYLAGLSLVPPSTGLA